MLLCAASYYGFLLAWTTHFDELEGGDGAVYTTTVPYHPTYIMYPVQAGAAPQVCDPPVGVVAPDVSSSSSDELPAAAVPRAATYVTVAPASAGKPDYAV